MDRARLYKKDIKNIIMHKRIYNNHHLAGWQSGYAAACKAVYAGSIPASASMVYNKILFSEKIWIKKFLIMMKLM